MRPLTGIRVIDLTHALSGPYCTFQLAMLGADVIKLEPPGEGDHFRQFLPDSFDAVNAGKRSVTVELGTSEGQSLVDMLVAGADVVVENFKAATSRKLNLSHRRFAACNPRIVSCAIRGFAGDSAFAERPAVEWSVQAQMGLTALYLDERHPARDLGIGMLDISTGANATSAILAGLLERGRTGEAQDIEVTMADAAMMLFAPHVDKQLKGQRKGKAPTRASVGRFRARDRQLFIMAATGAWFRALSDVLGEPHLVEDERFSDPKARETNADALLHEMEARLAKRDAETWEALLLEKGVPAAVVRDFPETVQLGGIGQSHSLVGAISHPRQTDVRIFGSGIGGEADNADLIVPSLGEHTEEVLSEHGLSAEQIEQLRQSGTV